MSEQIDRWFCACASYPDEPGMVVCWRCEQPLVEVGDDDTNAVLIQNLLGVCKRYHDALGWIKDNAATDALSIANAASAALYGEVPHA